MMGGVDYITVLHALSAADFRMWCEKNGCILVLVRDVMWLN